MNVAYVILCFLTNGCFGVTIFSRYHLLTFELLHSSGIPHVIQTTIQLCFEVEKANMIICRGVSDKGM